MRVHGTLATLWDVWRERVNHENPILYVTDQQDRVTECWPLAGLAGVNYSWVLTDKPAESVFLGSYPYAHKVDKVIIN